YRATANSGVKPATRRLLQKYNTNRTLTQNSGYAAATHCSGKNVGGVRYSSGAGLTDFKNIHKNGKPQKAAISNSKTYFPAAARALRTGTVTPPAPRRKCTRWPPATGK